VDSFEFRYDRWCGWLLGAMGHGRRLSRIEVDDHEIRVRMGLGFRATVPRASIVAVAESHGRVLGWGVHGWFGRWLVNGSSSGLVTMAIEPRVRAWVLGIPVRVRELTVSLVEPAAFVAGLAASPASAG
jgi:hypothetical protein